ncbi:MAG: DUF1553 domain-containing protein [Bacteroidota bacterium]
MWITSKENPLVARTIVNRVWEQMFGMGLVGNTGRLRYTGNSTNTPGATRSLVVATDERLQLEPEEIDEGDRDVGNIPTRF